jgi:formylglycine-generating enzyme required for sulfatase activity
MLPRHWRVLVLVCSSVCGARITQAQEAAASTPAGLGTGLGADQFVLIVAGTFDMGWDPRIGQSAIRDDRAPVHSVTISHDFWIQKTEVTQTQWAAVMGKNPSKFSKCGETCPVERVSWDDVQTFLKKLNASTPGVTYRLPTEAEWEYAARAGTTGNDRGDLDARAWHYANAGDKTHPVALKKPNAWGLYDTLGNVWEWVQDWYNATYYTFSPAVDPRGPGFGNFDSQVRYSQRVLRGGAWFGNPRVGGLEVRPATRFAREPLDRTNSDAGFRLVRVPAAG